MNTWSALFDDTTTSIIDEINEEGMCPRKCDIYKAFELTPLSNVKVVLIGQDPYPTILKNGNPRAIGISFAVAKGDAIPGSLKNIYKVLSKTIPEFVVPQHGDLTPWCKQGVLMLNKTLTVRESKPNSHAKNWSGFCDKVIDLVLKSNPECVFLLWGNNAQLVKRPGMVTLETTHPSPLSASRGFLGCNHFNETNEYLIKQGKEPIDWSLE